MMCRHSSRVQEQGDTGFRLLQDEMDRFYRVDPDLNGQGDANRLVEYGTRADCESVGFYSDAFFRTRTLPHMGRP